MFLLRYAKVVAVSSLGWANANKNSLPSSIAASKLSSSKGIEDSEAASIHKSSLPPSESFINFK